MKIKQHIPIKSIAITLLCMVSVLFLHTKASAQSLGSFTFSVSKTSVTASNEELVDLVLKLTNQTRSAITGTASVGVPANIEIVSKAETRVEVQPGDSIFIPVKLFVGRKALSGRVYNIAFTLNDQNNILMAQARTQLRVSVNRNVMMYAGVNNILLNSNTDSLRMPVHITNMGNTLQRITIVVGLPADVQDQAFHTTRQVQLQPGADVDLYFSKPVTKKMMNSDGFNVNISSIYENGDLISMAYIRVQSARSNRNYRDELSLENFNDNAITLSSQSMFAATQSYMVRGRGSVDIGSARASYNLDFTAWKNTNTQSLLQNTWIDLQQNNAGIRIGNISRMFDVNLYGRGAAAYYTDTAHNNRFEAGYINGDNNLLGSKYQFFPVGDAAWGTYTHTAKQWGYTGFTVYQNNPAQDSRDLLIGNTVRFSTRNNIHYNFTLNASRSSDYLTGTSQQYGVALGGGVNGSIGAISFNSSNYYSSGYYPGIQRGALNFSERVTWMRENSSLWISADYYRYQPKTISAAQFFLPDFSMLRAEAGYTTRINKFNLSVAPLYTRETSNAYQFGSAGSAQSLTAYNLNTTANYLLSGTQYISLNAEAGLYSSSFDTQKRFHLRSNAMLRMGIFSVNTTVQLGTFYMGEAANNFVSKTGPTYTINIIPTVQQHFLRNKLHAEASVAYMMSGYSGSSWYLAGRVEYDANRKTSVYTSVNHNRYAGYGYSILEMGITRKLPLPKSGEKTSSMELFVYKDINRNGVYDTGDSTAAGYLLYINNDIFVTSQAGTILYRNLPADNYHLVFPVTNGWYAAERTVHLDQKTRLEVALQTTGTVKGAISYTKSEFSYEIGNDRSNVVITATDASNHVFKTKTGMDGKYIFYIPVGTYTIAVDPASLPTEIEVPAENPQVVVKAGAIHTLNFEMKVKSKKIETKKFVSPALKNK